MISPKQVGIEKLAKTHLRERLGVYLSQAMEVCKCPVCQSKNIRESRFRFRDIPFVLLRAKPNRCMACYRRFYTWNWLQPAKSAPPLSTIKAK